MRKIEYIFIDSDCQDDNNKSCQRTVPNLGYHYVVNSTGEVLNPTDISIPAHLELGTWNLEPRERERLSACSIGVKYNGSLKHETCNLKQRAKLLHLLVDLRSQWPSAKILGVSEIGFGTLNFEPGTRGVIRPSDAMNQIRRTLSDLP